jgi:hypothetical protein
MSQKNVLEHTRLAEFVDEVHILDRLSAVHIVHSNAIMLIESYLTILI